jgi:hypothetical protein
VASIVDAGMQMEAMETLASTMADVYTECIRFHRGFEGSMYRD